MWASPPVPVGEERCCQVVPRTAAVNGSLLSSSPGQETGLLTPQCMLGNAAVSLINGNTVNKHL